MVCCSLTVIFSSYCNRPPLCSETLQVSRTKQICSENAANLTKLKKIILAVEITMLICSLSWRTGKVFVVCRLCDINCVTFLTLSFLYILFYLLYKFIRNYVLTDVLNFEVLCVLKKFYWMGVLLYWCYSAACDGLLWCHAAELLWWWKCCWSSELDFWPST